MAARRVPSRRSAVRRRTGWDEGPGSQSPAAITTTGQSFLGAASASLQDGLTVARIRGLLSFVQTVTTAAGDGFHGAVGIGITTIDAIAIGATATPGPITESSWDGWLWHQFFDTRQSVASGAAVDALTPQLFTIDSKAMRKIDEAMAIFAMIERTEVGTASMSVLLDSRMLLFLP